MIIKSIELNNIRSYKFQKIEFENGINFISGDIGSGKSSILQAIEFCLFGFKKGDLEAFQLLRKGEKSASIKLILENKTSSITICRNLKFGKNGITQANGHIVKDNEKIEFSPQELNAYVFNTLNFPKEFLTKDKNLIYRFTIYTPQEQLKEILFTESDKRLEVIRKIFGIDKYKLIADAISIYSKKIREGKKVYQTKLEPLNKYSKEILELNKNIEENQKKLNSYLIKEKEFLTKEVKVKNAISKREELLVKLNEKLIKYEKEKSKIESSQLQEKKLLEKIDILENFFKRNSQNELKSKEKNLLEMLTTFKSKLNKISKEKKKCEKDKDNYKKLIEAKENLNQKLLEIKSKKDYTKEFSKTFDYVLTKCQVKDLENFIKKDEKNIKKQEKLEKEFDELNEKKILNENKLELIEKEIKELNSKKANISSLKKCENCMQEVNEKHKEDIKKKILKNIETQENLKEKYLIKLEEINKKTKEIQIKLKEFGDVKTSLIEKQEKLKLLLEKEKQDKKLYEKLKDLKKEFKDLNEDKLNNELIKANKSLTEEEKSQKALNKLNKEELEFNNKINETKLEIQKLKLSQENIVTKEKELIELKKELKELDNIIKNTQKIEKNFEKFNESIKKYTQERKKLEISQDKLNQNLKLISNKTAAIENEVKITNKLIKEKESEIELLKKIEEKLEKLLKDENFLTNKLVNISSKIEKQVFTKYFVEFNELFIDIFRELIEDNEIDVRLNSEFSPVIEQNGFDTDIKNLSGGEKASLSIAYRLGLKKVIENNLEASQKLSLLVLDEPTDGLSENQVQRFGQVLKETQINQIIAVSHDEKMEAIADNVLRIEKINHKSQIYGH